MEHRPSKSRSRLRLLTVMSLLALVASVPAVTSIRTGEDTSGRWLEVEAGEFFDLLSNPGPEGGARLEFRGWSPEPGVAETLAELPGARLDVGSQSGAALIVPFSVGDLRSVQRLVDGWRFVFSPRTGTAATLDSSGDYRLGTRDVIAIVVHGHEDLSRTDAVPPDGILSFSLIGEIKVAGRTVAEIEEEIQRKLETDYLVDPKVTVRVSEYESQWVNVIGFVRTPGKYAIKGRTSLVDILTQAGGLHENAGAEIVVTRAGKGGGQSQFVVATDELFSTEDGGTFMVHHGDTVNVTEQAMFYIQGEVAKPGTYPLERGYTLLKAISVAGGMSQWADRKSVELHRDLEDGPQKIVVNLKAIEQRRKPDMELQPEDIIIVKRRLL